MSDELKNTLLVAGLLIVIVLAVLLVRSNINAKKQKIDDNTLVNSIADSIHKRNDSTSSISVLQTGDIKSFLELKFKDSVIQELQATVKQYKNKLQVGSSVTSTKLETTVNNTNKTKVDWDSINNLTSNKVDSNFHFIKVYPTYSDSIKNKWIDYRAVMNKDSSKLTLKVFDDFSTVVGVEKGKPFVDIINRNPYSTTTSIRAYQVVQPKPKRFGIGFSSGATYYNNKVQPYIGAGLNYNLFNF